MDDKIWDLLEFEARPSRTRREPSEPHLDLPTTAIYPVITDTPISVVLATSRMSYTDETSPRHSHRSQNGGTDTVAQAPLAQSLSPLKPMKSVSPTDLIDEADQYTNEPTRAREWLLSFGDLKPGTDVSLRFRITEENIQNQDPFSNLPFLRRWIDHWYSKTTARNSSRYDRDDFLWLLTYISDYIKLGHLSLNNGELASLCKSLMRVCEKTRRQEDIDGCINVLNAIIVENMFPKESLDEVLKMFSTAIVLLEKPPKSLSDCVELLSSGPLGQSTVSNLEQYTTKLLAKDIAKNLSCARGAVRHLASIIDTTDRSDKFVVDMPELMAVAHQASGMGSFRHCTEVLRLCSIILSSHRAREVTGSASSFTILIQTIHQCAEISHLHNVSHTVMPFELELQDHGQETQAKERRYFRERDSALHDVFRALDALYPDLNDEQLKEVYELLFWFDSSSTPIRTARLLQYIKDQGLCNPGTEKWEQRLQFLFVRFVLNSRIQSEHRINALEIYASGAHRITEVSNQDNDEHANGLVTSGKQIVKRLLDLVPVEVDTAVFQALLAHLVDLSVYKDHRSTLPYSSSIVKTLLSFITRSHDLDENIPDEHLLFATQSVRRIFFRGIGSNALVAVEAYEALLAIASPTSKSRRSRLAAMRVLFRLRSDDEGLIYVDTRPASEYIAAAVCRTDESHNLFSRDNPVVPRSVTSSPISQARDASPRQSWSYPMESSTNGEWDLPEAAVVSIRGVTSPLPEAPQQLKMASWLFVLMHCLQSDHDWETYSYMIVHLGAQLTNLKLFGSSLEAIVKLRQILCDQVVNNSFREPPTSSGLKKSDTALCLFNVLGSLIPYAAIKSEIIQKGFADDLIRAFLAGIGSVWEGTARGCIHALAVCCFEAPSSVASLYPSIVDKLSKSMTQSHLAIHILEFLAQVARLPEMHPNFTHDEIRIIFGVCIQFLEKSREQQMMHSSLSQRAGTPARHSGLSLRRPPYRAAMLQEIGLPQYASALAYHTMIFWFLSLKLDERARYVAWITPRLVWKNSAGEDTIDESSQVFIDMMLRSAFSDLGETAPDPSFAGPADGTITNASWLVGHSIVSVQTAGHSGLTQITKRQASGTTHAIYQQRTVPTPSHHVPTHTEIRPEVGQTEPTAILPPHVLLQMVTTAAPTSVHDQPISLPKEQFVDRAVDIFDRIPTVDSHKIGVLYVGDHQTKEIEFLANTDGSEDFKDFLKGLGYEVSLQPPLRFNPQGLQHPRDGKRTVAWRDRINEIVYHISTLMPNSEEDENNYQKKAHLGNCHVVIVFNRSGRSWRLEDFPSQVTFVNIVITPVDRKSWRTPEAPSVPEFYRVRVLTKEEYQNISPAADTKVVSRATLGPFVRMLALNANIFSQAQVAWNSGDGEFPSSWRARFQAIKRLRDQVMARAAGHSGAPVTANVGSGRRTPTPMQRGEDKERDKDKGALAAQLDFSKWTL